MYSSWCRVVVGAGSGTRPEKQMTSLPGGHRARRIVRRALVNEYQCDRRLRTHRTEYGSSATRGTTPTRQSDVTRCGFGPSRSLTTGTIAYSIGERRRRMTAVDQEGRTSRGTADLRPEVTWPPPALPGGSSTDGDASTRRRDAAIVAVIAAVAGLVATVANAEPTGRPVTDFVLVGVGVAVITALGSRAPWWMLVTDRSVVGDRPRSAPAGAGRHRLPTSRRRPAAADRPWPAVRALGGDHLQRPDQGRRLPILRFHGHRRDGLRRRRVRHGRAALLEAGAAPGVDRRAVRRGGRRRLPPPGSDTPCTHRATP